MNTPQEPTFEDNIAEVMRTLPVPIQNYLKQGKYSIVAKQLMAKYGLHVDQGGIVEREIALLIMGIENPDEFVKALAEEAKLDQQTINNIVRDVNAQIFVPLREEMRSTVGGSASGGKGVVQQMARPVIQPPRPVQQQPARPIAQPPTPSRPDLRNVLASITKEVRPGSQTSASPKLLEDHEEPHIEFHPTSPMATKGAGKPQPQAPRVIAPPTNLPGVIQPTAPPTPKPVPLRPAVASGVGGPPPPIIKEYSSDPYREPIEP